MPGNLQHGVWFRLVILQVLESDIKQQPSTGSKRSLHFYITNLFIETAIKYHSWRYSAGELTSVPMTHQPALERGNEFIIHSSSLMEQNFQSLILASTVPLPWFKRFCSFSLELDSKWGQDWDPVSKICSGFAQGSLPLCMTRTKQAGLCSKGCEAAHLFGWLRVRTNDFYQFLEDLGEVVKCGNIENVLEVLLQQDAVELNWVSSWDTHSNDTDPWNTSLTQWKQKCLSSEFPNPSSQSSC